MLARLGDCAWLQASLPALAFLESSSWQRRRLSAGYAEGFRAKSSPSQLQEAAAAAGPRGYDRVEYGVVHVMERLSKGCLSVGVLQPNGHML